MKNPADALQEIRDKGLLRKLLPVECEQEGMASLQNGERVVNFASNDYLGFACHPALVEAFAEGLGKFGAGAMASRLVTGTRSVHLQLEETLADIKGTEAALSFSSGYAASVGLIPSIVGKGDTVILDKLSHASLIDGAKLSGARIITFLHNDPRSLEKKLASIRHEQPNATILIVTESVFSMDGDRAPLREIAEIKNRYGALLLVDEAHGFGILGPHGEGLAAELGVTSQIDFNMGTLSKSVGLSGGYVACSRAWADLFVNTSRSVIYSTAPPPALACAALKSLELIRSREGDERRKHLASLGNQLCTELGLANGAQSAIHPLVIGGNQEAMDAAEQLKRRGFLAPAIRYPTVPLGTARLRITLTAAHSERQVSELSGALRDISLIP